MYIIVTASQKKKIVLGKGELGLVVWQMYIIRVPPNFQTKFVTRVHKHDNAVTELSNLILLFMLVGISAPNAAIR